MKKTRLRINFFPRSLCLLLAGLLSISVNLTNISANKLNSNIPHTAVVASSGTESYRVAQLPRLTSTSKEAKRSGVESPKPFAARLNFLNTQPTGAFIHVNTTAQGVDNTDGKCSLQEAIYSANFDNNIAIDSTNPDHFVTTECEPGSGDDTIVLPYGAVFQMSSIVDDAHNPMGPTATPIIFSNIFIEANGSRLEHVPNGVNFRAFAVGAASVDLGSGNVKSGTGNLEIRGAYIIGFTVKGGNGTGGGGGGLGAGGAIYVRGGGLSVDGSTFEANGAAGGNGGNAGSSIAFSTAAGGGGGGFAGNGGQPNFNFINSNGGGGGGSRGNGGDAAYFRRVDGNLVSTGGGGGGTITDGGTGTLNGGFTCGGSGGGFIGGGNSYTNDGQKGTCAGGGGGGGNNDSAGIAASPGKGGKGNYGGGGGGGGYDTGDGGDGGFGGGGGGGAPAQGYFGPQGGNGGFGAGGGAAVGGIVAGGPGNGGTFAGNASALNGGGGAALGGAIFNDSGNVRIFNSTFTRNFVTRGVAGGSGSDTAAQNGRDEGGAIFSLNGSLEVNNSTISGNESTGEGGGIVVYQTTTVVQGFNIPIPTSFNLRNTILANQTARECFFEGPSVTHVGSGNLIVNNYGCPGMVSSADPQLGPLQINPPGSTPTMAISPTSPAFNAADSATALSTDQRGVMRPQRGGFDIGAFEVGYTQPTITLASVSPQLQQNATGGVFTIATVSDAEDGAGSLTVTATSVPAGITISNITNTNGTITANIAVGCGATIGTNTIGLKVTDSDGSTSTASLIVNVTPSAPPVIKLNPSISLWPPNHTYQTMTVIQMVQSATDDCDGDLTSSVVIEKVTSDEADNAPGDSDGNTVNDIVIGPDCKSVQLRAERDDKLNGRVYVVTLHVRDSSGNTTRAEFKVTVPLSQNGNPAVQDATALTVMSRCP